MVATRPALVSMLALFLLQGAIAIDPSVIKKSQNVHVEVDSRPGMTHGMTICDWGTCYDGMERERRVRWVTDIYLGKYERLLEDALK